MAAFHDDLGIVLDAPAILDAPFHKARTDQPREPLGGDGLKRPERQLSKRASALIDGPWLILVLSGAHQSKR